jgi:hypothetical protein
MEGAASVEWLSIYTLGQSDGDVKVRWIRAAVMRKWRGFGGVLGLDAS